jgi:serine/threonine protein kinase
MVDLYSKCQDAMLIDFGLSSKYNDNNGEHIKNIKLSKARGYPAFLSRNVLELNTPSRRDDLISLILTMIFMMAKNTSWYSKTSRSQLAQRRLTETNE